MGIHLKAFRIIQNLHDLACIGSKDSKEALSNVQDYNMTKIFSQKCSIPDRQGVHKNAVCDMDMIQIFQKDISLYNYIDSLLRKIKLGTLEDQIKEKIKLAKSAQETTKKGTDPRKAEMIRRA